MILTAISPLLAMRTLENNGVSERNVSVLFRRILVALSLERAQGFGQSGACIARISDVLEIPSSRSAVWMRELIAVLLDLVLGRLRRIVTRGNVFSKENLHRALWPHHCDLRRGPGHVEVAANVLRAHDVVRSAVRLARNDGELRDRRLAISIEKLGAVLD